VEAATRERSEVHAQVWDEDDACASSAADGGADSAACSTKLLQRRAVKQDALVDNGAEAVPASAAEAAASGAADSKAKAKEVSMAEVNNVAISKSSEGEGTDAQGECMPVGYPCFINPQCCSGRCVSTHVCGPSIR